MFGVAEKSLDTIKLKPLKTFTSLSKSMLFFGLVEFQHKHLLWRAKTLASCVQNHVYFAFNSKEND